MSGYRLILSALLLFLTPHLLFAQEATATENHSGSMLTTPVVVTDTAHPKSSPTVHSDDGTLTSGVGDPGDDSTNATQGPVVVRASPTNTISDPVVVTAAPHPSTTADEIATTIRVPVTAAATPAPIPATTVTIPARTVTIPATTAPIPAAPVTTAISTTTYSPTTAAVNPTTKAPGPNDVRTTPNPPTTTQESDAETGTEAHPGIPATVLNPMTTTPAVETTQTPAVFAQPTIEPLLDDNTESESISTLPSGPLVPVQGTSAPPIFSGWMILVVVCIVLLSGICCVAVGVISRKRRSKQNFGPGHMNGRGQRSKKKKGAEDDAWAGPVNLGGVDKDDCDGMEAGLQDDKGPDGEDMVLSTFAPEGEKEGPDGGVGGAGTKEAQKWEEESPLLYIDEDAEEEPQPPAAATAPPQPEQEQKDAQNGQNEKAEERKEEEKDTANLNGQTEMNGGAAFCLTTAV